MNQTEVTAHLQRLVSELVDAWNRGDIATYSSAFASDAEFVDTSGGLTSGHDAIAAVHEQEYAKGLAGTKIELVEAAVRPLSDDVAIVRIQNRFQPGDRRIVMTAVFSRKGEEWKIVVSQASLKK